MSVRVERIDYHGWHNSYRISNGDVELVVTTDVGPRIIRYAFRDGQNLFVEFPDQMGKSGERGWMPRGGHRIWIAPEDRVRSYPADNFAVEFEESSRGVRLTAPVERESSVQKQIEVNLDASGTGVTVRHVLTNRADVAQTLSPWALTMMAPGGLAITGFPPRGTHPEVLMPSNPLVMWAFTDISDPRWKFTSKYLLLRQDPTARSPQKIGHFNPYTWGAYLLGTELFLKEYAADPLRAYPDFGCSYETFTNADTLEIETLGPLVQLAPGESTEHTERWSLNLNVKLCSLTDKELDEFLLPKLRR
jgi:hypothetical protein